MKDARDVVMGLLRTEKGAQALPLNKYLFWVDRRSNKIEIARAVQEIYKVQVQGVNTINVRGKLKRVRHAIGKSADWKKAIVTLKTGSKIDVT